MLYCKEIKGGWKAAHMGKPSAAEPPGPGRGESSLRAAKILSKITEPDMLGVDLPFEAGVPKQAEALRCRHPAMLRTRYALKLRALNKKKKKKNPSLPIVMEQAQALTSLEINGAWVEMELGPAGSHQHPPKHQQCQQIINTKRQHRGWLLGAAKPWQLGRRFSFPRETQPQPRASQHRGETHPQANETQSPLSGRSLQQQATGDNYCWGGYRKIYVQTNERTKTYICVCVHMCVSLYICLHICVYVHL